MNDDRDAPDLSDIQVRLDAEKSVDERRVQYARAYADVFGSPAGKMVLADILEQAGMLTIVRPPADADVRSFNDGARSIGQHIVQRLRWSEMQLLQLEDEAQADRLEEIRAERAGMEDE